MRKLFHVVLLGGWTLCVGSLGAQQVCPGLPYVADTPEDELMQAVNGAENPQEQIAALDKFGQAHADSKFMPCVEEYYTIVYLKQNNFDKVIEHGEKGLAGSNRDVMLIMNTTRGYLASGKVSDTVIDAILKAPEQLKTESNPSKPPNVGDTEWQKNLQDLAEQANDQRNYLEFAFFQLLLRVPDGNKRIQFLDSFTKAYPDSKNVGQINFHNFIAYKMTNNPAKADEYGEKAIASDPTNVATLNLVADDYAARQTNQDKAAQYAKKVLELVPNLKKPEGMSEDQFKSNQNTQLGLAHLTLGYVDFQKAGKTRRVGPAIQEFKTAIDLLNANPELQGKALYFLGNAFEFQYPPNHRAAIEALTRASDLKSPWQSQCRTLLAKVKEAAGQ